MLYFFNCPGLRANLDHFGFCLFSLTSCTLDHLATVSLLTVIILNKVAMPPKCFFDRQRGQLRHHPIEKFSPFKGAPFLKKHVLNWNWGAMFVQVSMSRTVSAKRGFKMSMTWSGLAIKTLFSDIWSFYLLFTEWKVSIVKKILRFVQAKRKRNTSSQNFWYYRTLNTLLKVSQYFWLF